MRIPVASLSKKFISTFFAATLAVGLIPAAAFAVDGENSEAADAARVETENNVISSEEAEGDTSNLVISSGAGEAGADEKSAPIEDNGDEVATDSSGESETLDSVTGGEDAIVIPAATQRINEDVALTSRTVAQAESIRSYFLAQTLESTRTVPIVSANLPLDTGSIDAIEVDGDSNAASEDEGGEDSDESDPAPGVIAAESTVVGSFTYLGMTFAVEPGGESVALVAVDYSKLSETYIEKQVIVIPDVVTAGSMSNYSVTRIADNAFASLTKENANEDYKGCEALFTEEELLAEAGIDAAEIEAFLNPESEMVDIDGDGEADTPANPLKDCTGILAMGVPASVTNIGDEAFAGFDTLQYLVVSEDNPNYASYDGVLYNADLTNLRLIPEGRVGAVRVAPSATDVEPEVFSHCPSVTTLVADPESSIYQLLEEADTFEIAIVPDSNFGDESYATQRESALDVVSTLSSRQSYGEASYTIRVYSQYNYVWFEDRSVLNGATPDYDFLNRGNGNTEKEMNIGFPCAKILSRLDSQGFQMLSAVDASGHMHATFSGFKSDTPGYYTTKRLVWRNDGDTEVPLSDAGLTQSLSVALRFEKTKYTFRYYDDPVSNTNSIVDEGLDRNQPYTQIDHWYTVLTEQQTGFEKPGYYIANWYVKGNDKDTPFSPGASCAVTSLVAANIYRDPQNSMIEIPLRPRWAPRSYSVKLDNQSATNAGTTSVTATYDKQMPTSIAIPARTGYTFGGYYTAVDGGGTQYFTSTGQPTDNAWTIAEDSTLYAKWTPNLYWVFLGHRGSGDGTVGFYVKYNTAFYKAVSDGAGGFKASVDSTITEIVAPTYDGYTFAGYYTDANGAGTRVLSPPSPGGDNKIPLSSKLLTEYASIGKLYGHWTPNTIKCYWKSGSELFTTTSANYAPDTPIPMPADDPIRPGYKFAGWYDDDDGVTKPVDSSFKLRTGDWTYYAHWTAETITITWDLGWGATYAQTSATYSESARVPMPENNPTNPGYWFAGWYTTRVSSDARLVTANSSLPTSDTTYYARWGANKYSISYEMNGHGTAPSNPEDLRYTYSIAKTLPDPAAVIGYTFGGWYWEKECESPASITKTTIEDQTVWAKWIPNEYTVTLNTNGGSGGTENVTAIYDADMPTDGVVIPTKDGYTFSGYYSAAEGGDQYYTAKGESTRTWNKAENSTLYAHWTKATVSSIELSDPTLPTASRTIWYWPPNGYVIEAEDSTTTVSALDKVPTVADYPFLVDYEFKGYFDGTGDDATKMIDADGTILAGAQATNTTWYAKWDRLSCAVVLDATYGGILEVTEGTKRIDKAVFGEPFASSFTDTFVKPERVGYTFKGYYTEPNPEVATGGTYSGTCWIDGTPALLGTWAKPAGLAEKAAVTLFAAWELNDCTVVYDLRTPDDTEEVRGTYPSNDTWHYGVAIPETLPTPSSGGFFRNGYQFKGWYYEKTDEDGDTVKVFVSNPDGTRKLEQWDQDMTSVTLKAEWEANEYVVVFDEAYPSIEGLPTPTSPTYERTFKYDAVFDVTDPTYAPYSFAGWRLKLPPNTTVAGADGTAGVHTTLSSNGKLRFTPQGDLASQAKINIEAVWNAPQDATYHLYYWTPGADDPAIRVVDKTYSYAETKTLGRSTYPAAVTGWNPTAGWVEVKPGNGKTGDEVARELIASGGPDRSALTTSSFGPRESTEKFFVFKWTAVPFSIAFKDAPDGDDDDAYVKPTDVLVNATADDGDVLSWEQACSATKTGDWSHATSLAYDVSVRSFKLPAVSRKGYDFLGWEQVSPKKPLASDPIDPKAIAEDTDLQELVFAPKFEESEYTIVFKASENDREIVRTVGYTDTFTFPYPDAQKNGRCFSSWEAEDGTTYMPNRTVPVAEQEDGAFALSDLDTDGDKVIRFSGVWLSAYRVDVPVRVTTMAIDTETGDMIAAGNSITPALKPSIADEEYEVISLRTEPVLDANGNAPFSGAGEGKVYLSVYADMTEPADETALLKKENVGEKGVITYTDKATSKLRTSTPLLLKMGENAISFANKGTDTDENALSTRYGFRTFTSKSPLYIRYGLVFEGVEPKAFDFKAASTAWTLPDKDFGNTSTAEDRQPGWSSKSAPLAKLIYTVRLINE